MTIDQIITWQKQTAIRFDFFTYGPWRSVVVRCGD